MKEQLKRQKKAKVGKLKLDSLIAEIKVKEKVARDLKVKAADIDARHCICFMNTSQKKIP